MSTSVAVLSAEILLFLSTFETQMLWSEIEHRSGVPDIALSSPHARNTFKGKELCYRSLVVGL